MNSEYLVKKETMEAIANEVRGVSGNDYKQRPQQLLESLQSVKTEIEYQADELEDLMALIVSKACVASSVELNIVYGDTAPEDTSKLWVKTEKPNGVIISPNAEKVEVGGEQNITTLTDVALLTPLGSGACIAVGTKVYLFGGKGSSESAKIQIFDTVANTVTYAPNDLPTATNTQGCVVVGKNIYVIGGDKTTKKVVMFDTETYEVSQPISYLTNEYRNFPCCVAYDEKIYIISTNGSKVVTCFDTSTNTETVLSTTSPDVRYGACCAVIDNMAYVLGGYNNGGNISTIWRFNPKTIEFEELSPSGASLTALKFSCCAAVGSKIYMFGGLDANSTQAVEIVCYDTEANSVEKLPLSLPTAMYRISCAAVGNKVYLLGGYGGAYFSTIQCFSSTQLALLVASGAVQIVPNTENNIFALINTDTVKAEIGVDKVYKGNAQSIGEEVEAALYKDGAWTNI